MSSITLSEAAQLSQPDITGRYHFNGRRVDQFFEILSMEAIEGHAKRINVAEGVDIHDHATVVGTNGAAIATTQPTVSARVSPLAHLAAQLEIDSLVASQYSSWRDVVRAQLELKVAAVLGLYQQLLVNGDAANPGEFDGLLQLAGSNMNGADNNNANGGIVAAGEVERTIADISTSGGLQGRYLVMRTDAYYHLYRHNYAQNIFVIQHPTLGPLPSIAGVPILLDDYIRGDEVKGSNSATTTIFAVNLGRDRGLCGTFPARNRGREVTVRGPVTRESTDTIHFEISAQLGLAAYATPAVAGLSGVAHQL